MKNAFEWYDGDFILFEDVIYTVVKKYHDKGYYLEIKTSTKGTWELHDNAEKQFTKYKEWVELTRTKNLKPKITHNMIQFLHENLGFIKYENITYNQIVELNKKWIEL